MGIPLLLLLTGEISLCSVALTRTCLHHQGRARFQRACATLTLNKPSKRLVAVLPRRTEKAAPVWSTAKPQRQKKWRSPSTEFQRQILQIPTRCSDGSEGSFRKAIRCRTRRHRVHNEKKTL